MKYRLLIAIEVLEIAETLSRIEQRALRKRFVEIAAAPHQFADYPELDAQRREVDVHIFQGFAIQFWEDATDRHVKILELRRADR